MVRLLYRLAEWDAKHRRCLRKWSLVSSVSFIVLVVIEAVWR